MFASGECVARIYCICSVVGDTNCFSVFVIIWCCLEEFDASVLKNLMLVQSLMYLLLVNVF